MPRLAHFEEYQDRYPDFALEKTDDGILLIRSEQGVQAAFRDEARACTSWKPPEEASGRATRCGAVTSIQRFGSAMSLNLRFQTLALDDACL